MAFQLLFDSDICQETVYGHIAKISSDANPTLPRIMPRKYLDPDVASLLPTGCIEVIQTNAGYGEYALLYDPITQCILNQRTQLPQECPPIRTIAELYKITSMRGFNLELKQIFSDLRKISPDEKRFHEIYSAWKETMQGYHCGKLDGELAIILRRLKA
jgi:hypothetical protein